MYDLKRGRTRYGATITDPQIMEVGRSLGVDFEKVDPKEFMKGFRVELEHSDVTMGDPIQTARIALAHLEEVADYYTKLEKVED